MGEDDGPTPVGRQDDVVRADERCVAVDAGAGSGKTTTMIWRIEHLIDDGHVTDPGDVLVLTFANEAAASIQDDINDADGLSTSEAYNIDVSTYHSFCNRLVSTYAYQLGIDPEFEVITPDKRSRILHRLAVTNDYEYLTDGDGSREAIVGSATEFVAELRREGVAPEDLEAVLPSSGTIAELQEMVTTLERAATDLLQFDDWDVIADFEAYDANAEPLCSNLEKYCDVLRLCRERAVENAADGPDVETWTQVRQYLEFMIDLATRMGSHLESEPDWVYALLPRAMFCDDVIDKYWPEVRQTPFGYLNEYVAALDDASRLQGIYRDYRDHLDREGALDFHGLIARARELLDDPVVRDEIAGEWDYVFCDEFQDTDSAQLDIVTKFCAAGDAQLLAIGDTNQAIYGWRGANPEGLSSLDGQFSDSAAIELNRNFRSRQPILDLVNYCDAYESKELEEDTQSDDDSDPSPAGDGGEAGGGEEAEEVHLAAVNSGYTDLSTPEEVATTVSLLLEGRIDDVPERTLGDLAIVVRKNWHAEVIAAELDERQIPYSVEGGVSGEIDPGVQTLLSYFKALVRPRADVHLYRVLAMLYRVPESDLETLLDADDSLVAALLDAETGGGSSFERPDAVERARSDYTTLAEIAESQSLSNFYRRFLALTRIEWFVQEESRDQFSEIEGFIERYRSDEVLRTLDDEFVGHLESYLEVSGSETARGIASESEDRVDLMTVHQAKGLEFDTVLFPYLNERDWYGRSSSARRAHRYESLVEHADGGIAAPLAESVHRDQVREDWRVFHVGATRAESLLVLFGEPREDPEFPAHPAEDVRATYAPGELLRNHFGDEITPWRLDMPTADIWRHVYDAFRQSRDEHPDSVRNITTDVDDAGDLTLGNILYYSSQLEEVDEAVETLFDLADDLEAGTLDAVDPERIGIESPDLGFDDGPTVPVVHSHTSIETYANCPRRHLLDHVLGATADPVPAEAAVSRDDDPSPKAVGTVFHAVAEEAFYRSADGKDEWTAIAERTCRARNETVALEAVEECIDRYFGTDVPGWDPVGAELPFELEAVPGVEGPVIGYVDSVRRHPEKGLVVLDYKSSYDTLDPEASSQLLLYLRACEDLFEEPVDWAGYVYVGEAAADHEQVAFVHRDQLEEEWSEVVATLRAADDPSWTATPGEHCQHCLHRSLGCGPDEYAYDNEFVVDPDD
jgi:ATP-dependent helicase/nuclease subunit A